MVSFGSRCLTFIVAFPIMCVLKSVSKHYCSITCNGERRHTMCIYEVPSLTCKGIEKLYSPEFAREMLDYHNDLRNDLANGSVQDLNLPTASNMRQMKWDQELAAIANRWILQCIVGHDSCRDTENEKVGQNIAFISIGEFDVYDGFDLWHDEIDQIQSTDIKSFNDARPEIFNISQILWHSTTKVGCSVIAFHDEQMYFTACNYSPKGNLAGQPIYMEGPPCRNCPPNTNCVKNHKYRFLCIQKADENNKEDFLLPDTAGSVEFDTVLLLLMQCVILQCV